MLEAGMLTITPPERLEVFNSLLIIKISHTNAIHLRQANKKKMLNSITIAYSSTHHNLLLPSSNKFLLEGKV
jgi:hypothetical protein